MRHKRKASVPYRPLWLMAALWFAAAPVAGLAFEGRLAASGADEALTATLTRAASSIDPEGSHLSAPPQILAAALSDYRSLVQVLYDAGHFSPEISIKINGREAVDVLPNELGSTVASVVITVDPGPVYRFGQAEIGPLAPDTELPDGFAPGKTATTGTLRDTTRDAILTWREAGHAKADIAEQSVTAVHDRQQLDVAIRIVEGPKLRFGEMNIAGDATVRPEAIARIAGFPTGETYSPADVKLVATRLQRTGAFSGVTVTEAKTPNPDGTLDFTTTVVDQKRRRISLGGEISSRTGLDLSAVWTHRNLFGAAERLRLEARIRNIGGQDELDGLLGFRLDEPARLGADSILFWTGGIELRDKPFYRLFNIGGGVGVRRVLSTTLFYEVQATPSFARSDDAFGDDRPFDYLLFPIRAELNRRNDGLNPTQGYFVSGVLRPMMGLRGTQSALGAVADGRGYFGLFNDRLVLAARAKLGTTYGAEISEISPRFLFYSGGAGTVRGQPYEELGVPVNNGIAGGRSTFILNTEVRVGVTKAISLVGFYDYGAVGAEQFIDKNAPAQSGAGLGLRYNVPGFGPIRADFGWPVLGDTGSGMQIYLGIGQAF